MRRRRGPLHIAAREWLIQLRSPTSYSRFLNSHDDVWGMHHHRLRFETGFNWTLQRYAKYETRETLFRFIAICDVKSSFWNIWFCTRIKILIKFHILLLFIGLQRSLPILTLTRHYQKSEAAAVTAKGNTKDLTNSLQSARRAGAARRFLSQSGRLVSAKCSCRGSRQLRVSLECLYESSKSTSKCSYHLFFQRCVM